MRQKNQFLNIAILFAALVILGLAVGVLFGCSASDETQQPGAPPIATARQELCATMFQGNCYTLPASRENGSAWTPFQEGANPNFPVQVVEYTWCPGISTAIYGSPVLAGAGFDDLHVQCADVWPNPNAFCYLSGGKWTCPGPRNTHDKVYSGAGVRLHYLDGAVHYYNYWSSDEIHGGHARQAVDRYCGDIYSPGSTTNPIGPPCWMYGPVDQYPGEIVAVIIFPDTAGDSYAHINIYQSITLHDIGAAPGYGVFPLNKDKFFDF